MATISVLMENEEFLKGLVEATTPAELGELFIKNNIELEEGLSLEEAFEIVKKQESVELSEAELESVAGGAVDALWIFSTAWKITKIIAKSCWNAGKWFANNVG